MADSLQVLSDALKEALPGEADTIKHLTTILSDPASPPDLFRQAVVDYRATVRRAALKMLPDPIRAVPGVEILVNRALDEAFSTVEGLAVDAVSGLSIGPASGSLMLPPVSLPDPGTGRATIVGLLPPSGLSLELGAGPARGGGSLDYRRTPNERLSGFFGVKMGVINVSALAILEDAPAGMALTTLLSARFMPGIQLGFGFAITGVGGLIGINRQADASVLEAQFRSGALANALFGDDPIGSAASTLATLAAVFRAQAGSHVFGPTFQLTWLKIGTASFFSLDMGIFAQLPGLSRIDILASARVEIPVVFRLRLDVLGTVDIPRQLIGVHAVIVDSHIMGIFRLSGEALFRLHYGPNPYVVLTVGGFYPGFNPAPAEVPAQIQRVGLALDLPVDLPLYFRAEGYFAVTSNTFQFGMHLDAGIDADLFSATGHLYVDSIFQFSPFKFKADFAAGFELKVLGETFSGVNFQGMISGPGPVVIQGRIEYETPFFLPDISWSETFTFGSPVEETPRIGDLLEALRPELANTGNLRAEDAADRWVAISPAASPDGVALLAPRGSLIWSQKRTPFGLPVRRFEGGVLTQERNIVTVTPETTDPARPPKERFSPGMFRDLLDSEKANLPRFEEHTVGVRITFDDKMPAGVEHTIQYAVFYMPVRLGLSDRGLLFLHREAIMAKLLSRDAVPVVANRSPVVKLVPETWQAGAGSFDTQVAAHVHAQQTASVARLKGDLIDMGGV